LAIIDDIAKAMTATAAMTERWPDLRRDANIRCNRTNEELDKSYQWINHKKPYLQLEVNDIQWVHVTCRLRGIDNVCATRVIRACA
jgi:hypothetical protein